MAENLQVDDIVNTSLGPAGFSKGFRTPNGVYATAINYAVLTTDGYNQIDVTTGASTITITLPTTASSAGRSITVVKVDSGAGSVTISPATGLISGAASSSLTAQYDTLTAFCDGTAWYIIAGDPLYQQMTLNTVITPNGAGASASASIGIVLVRNGKMVTLNIPGFTCASTGTSSTTLSSSAGIIPTEYRPTSINCFTVGAVIDNGARIAAAGVVRITNAGTLQFYRDGTFNTNYTNSAGAGVFDSIDVTYLIP